MMLTRPALMASIASILAALAACGSTPVAVPHESEPTSAVVRLVTWNVHDLFDAEDRTTAPGEADLVLTPTEVEAKLTAIGRVLARIDPDVAILQEVENEPLLRRLASGPLGTRGRYESFLREGYDPRGIDVGVLSRLPFEPGPSHLQERSPDGHLLWSRDPVEIHFEMTPRPLVIVGAHLISRIDPRDDTRRLLQAARLREIGDTLRDAPGHPSVAVVGDLNDLPAAPALIPLVGDGQWIDLGRALVEQTAWTWAGSGLRERMDYALMSRMDAGVVIRVAVEDGPDVSAASDHRPLVVDLWLGPEGGR